MQIIRRAEWGALPPKSRRFVSWPDGVDLWVHHTAGSAPQSVADAKAELRRIQRQHMFTDQLADGGASDIAYHWAADEAGNVYECRGLEVWGAHSPGVNHQPAIVLLGTYTDREPTDAQHRAVYALRKHIEAGNLRGHRENTATSCPGDAAMRKIVNGPPPKITDVPDLDQLPGDATLRVVVNGRQWSGWRKAAGALRWIDEHGLARNSDAAIAWMGEVWRGPQQVTGVARNLTRRFL